MRDNEHGHLVLGKVAHDAEHFARQFRVERRGRLVKEQNIRIHHQRAGDGDALLLSAGETAGHLVGAVGHADLGQQVHRLFPQLGAAAVLDQAGRDFKVLHDGQMRVKIEVLEHHAHAQRDGLFLLDGDVSAVPAQRAPVDDNGAAGDRFQVDQAPQQRALARTGGTDDGDHVALFYRKAHVPQHFQRAEILAQILHLDDAHGGFLLNRNWSFSQRI